MESTFGSVSSGFELWNTSMEQAILQSLAARDLKLAAGCLQDALNALAARRSAGGILSGDVA
jgi:hypothetical protein